MFKSYYISKVDHKFKAMWIIKLANQSRVLSEFTDSYTLWLIFTIFIINQAVRTWLVYKLTIILEIWSYLVKFNDVWTIKNLNNFSLGAS